MRFDPSGRLAARVGLALVCVFAACACRADGEASLPRPQFSSSRRFAAVGTNSILNMESLLGVEEFTSRLESLLGRPLPAGPTETLTLVFSAEPDSGPGVQYREAVSVGAIQQRVWISPEAAARPSPRAMDVISFLLLSRYARSFAPALPGPIPRDHVPDWMAVGLADYIWPAIRLNAYLLAHRMVMENRLPEWSQALTWVAPELPDRENPDRAVSVALVGWIVSMPDSRKRLEELLRLFSAGPVSPDRIGAVLFGPDVTPRMADMQWRLWAASLEGRMPGMIREPDLVRRDLQRRLDLPGALFRDAGWAGVPDRITPETLLAHRGESWTKPAAHRMLWSLTRLHPLSLPETLRSTPGRVMQWLDAVSRPAPSRFIGWLYDRPSSRALAADWRQIEQTLKPGVAPVEERPSGPDGEKNGPAPGPPDTGTTEPSPGPADSHPPFSVGGNAADR